MTNNKIIFLTKENLVDIEKNWRKGRLNTRRLFLEEYNDGLVGMFRDKIDEYKIEINRLYSMKEKKERPEEWELWIMPHIKYEYKEINRYKKMIERIRKFNKPEIDDQYINIQEVLNKVDPIDLIGGFVKLVKSGNKEWKGLCPFHNERTPSFFVNEDTGLYHCFGCGASGNSLTFVIKYEGFHIKKALDYLNKRY